MKLKIGLVIEKFFPSLGGAETYAYHLARGLLEREQEVHIFAETWEKGSFPFVFHPLKIPRKPRVYHILQFALSSRKALRENPMDVSLGIGRALGMDIYQPHGGVHRSNLQQTYGIHKGLSLIREFSKILSPKQWAFLLLEKIQYSSSSILRFVALSKRVKRDMERHYPLSKERISLLYNGVDTECFSLQKRDLYRETLPSDLPQPDGKTFTLLFMGHNFSLKGLGTALEALKLLKNKHPSLRLLVVGRGKKRFYQFQARRLGVEREVVFLGPVSHPEYLYALADVLIHPTFYDPCSLVCMEALASGLPVLTTLRNGVAELMNLGGGFLVSDPHDGLSFARALEGILEKDCWEALSKEAYSIGRQYSLDKNISGMMEIFREIALIKGAI